MVLLSITVCNFGTLAFCLFFFDGRKSPSAISTLQRSKTFINVLIGGWMKSHLLICVCVWGWLFLDTSLLVACCCHILWSLLINAQATYNNMYHGQQHCASKNKTKQILTFLRGFIHTFPCLPACVSFVLFTYMYTLPWQRGTATPLASRSPLWFGITKLLHFGPEKCKKKK